MTKARTNADNVTADIAGITAGTGITGGGTSGTVTITNDMATTIAAAGDLIYGTANDAYAALSLGTAGKVLKVNSGATAPEWAVDPTTDVVTTAGDLIYGTGADAVARLGIGTASQVLAVNSGATAPEWITPSAGGMTLLSTTSLSGSSTTISSINQTYTDLKIVAYGVNANTGSILRIAPNGTTNIAHHTWYADYGGSVSTNWQMSDTGYINLNSNTGNNTSGNANNAWEIRISNYSSTAFRKQLLVNGTFDYAGNIKPAFWMGGINTTSAISSLVFSVSAGTFTGTVLVYGVK